MKDSGYNPLFPWEAVVGEYLYRPHVSSSDSDKLISVWIAFNAWMKGQFGTKLSDRDLINYAKTYGPLKKIFEGLKKSNLDFAEALGSFSDYKITNEKTSVVCSYNRTFDSLIETIYTIRCNTVHGTDLSGMSSNPHLLAFEILYRLLRKIVEPTGLLHSKWDEY